MLNNGKQGLHWILGRQGDEL